MFQVKADEFDLVITDMTDATLAANIINIRPHIPIILCTDFSKQLLREPDPKIGIRALVYKSVVMSELAKTVRTVLDESATPSAVTTLST